MARKYAEPARRYADDIQPVDHPMVRARGNRRSNITSDLELTEKVQSRAD